MIISPKIAQVLKPGRNNKSLILTGGGLCPGINTLVQNLRKSDKIVYGSMHGYNGIEIVHSDDFDYNIQGSCLGMSRDKYEPKVIAECLQEHEFSQIFVIGGDGSLSIAHNIAKMLINTTQVIGIPKTIDNDIAVVDHSFGFYSAVDATVDVIDTAIVEAQC